MFFALPGNWLIVISTCVFAWWRAEDGVFSVYTLVFITVLAVVGEVMEFLGSFAGAKKTGATLSGSIGAVFGAIVGTFVIPSSLLGTVLGACLGAGLATWSVELLKGRQAKHSVRNGVGAGMGELIGMVSKFAIGCVIWFVVAIAVFWP